MTRVACHKCLGTGNNIMHGGACALCSGTGYPVTARTQSAPPAPSESAAAAADQPIPTLDQWIEALRGTGYLTWRQAHECATLVLNMLGAQCK